MYHAFRRSLGWSLVVALVAVLSLIQCIPASAAASPRETQPTSTVETSIIQQTAALLPCASRPTITLTDPLYAASCATDTGMVSITLERFATAKEADVIFGKRYASITKQPTFHGYRAATTQRSAKSTLTSLHGWVADQWLVTAVVVVPTTQARGIAPITLSETLYTVGVAHNVFR